MLSVSTQTFRTVLKTNPQKKQISYESHIALLGSCFSENIGDKFAYFKFDTLTNPYGILFHPLAIEKALTEITEQKEYLQKDLFFHNEQWHSFQHHSDFSAPTAAEVLTKINREIEISKQFFKDASHVLITLGTAWCYEHFQSQTAVGNCHKIPQKAFSKKLLRVSEIVSSLQNIQKKIHQNNPSAILIFTLSPVRHLKDGMVENSLSKAHLLAGIQQVTDQKTSFYFPSYEIVMDDLRDYRFFDKDLVHPNETAVDYIWKQFQETWIHPNTVGVQKQVAAVQKALRHKALDQGSEAHKKFLKELDVKKELLKKKYHIDF
jgi:hypothetical protein